MSFRVLSSTSKNFKSFLYNLHCVFSRLLVNGALAWEFVKERRFSPDFVGVLLI